MQHPGTDTISPGPCLGKEKQTAFAHVSLTTRVVVSYNSGIPASEGNPALYVQANGSNNMSSAPFG